MAGWINRRVLEETGDHQRAQGWSPFVLDTNGNGKRDDWVEPNQPVDPAKDKRVAVGFYSVVVNPQDGTVWGQSLSPLPGYAVRFDPKTQLTGDLFAADAGLWRPRRRHRPQRRVLDVAGERPSRRVRPPQVQGAQRPDRDRRSLSGRLDAASHAGPATSRACEEEHSAEGSYYTWVDWFNTGGLGENVPIATGNQNSSLLALVNGKWVNLVVPYPMGFFTKWVEGRIDDRQCRLEGQGPVGHLFQPHHVPSRRRQGRTARRW